MRYIFIFLLSCLALACNDESQKNTESTNTDTEKPIDSTALAKEKQELSARYHHFIKKKGTWYSPYPILEKGKIYPFDEAPRDTAFLVFRETLVDAIKHKNVFHLLDKIDKNIYCSLADKKGSAAFVEMWGLESAVGIDSSLVWEILTAVLTNGGAFLSKDHTAFIAPYFHATDNDDFFQPNVLIAAQGVRIRTSPDLSADILVNVSHQIVELLSYEDKEEIIGGETSQWAKIKLANGKEGYVWGKFIAHPFDYRVGFKKQENGDWSMTFLVAGG